METSLSLLDRLTRCTDDLSWEQFVAIYRPLILRQLQRMKIAPQDCDDVLQETLRTIYQSLQGFTHNGRVGAFRKWLYAIVQQRGAQYWQQRHRRQQVFNLPLTCDPIDATSDLEELWDQEHDRYVIEQLLDLIQAEFTRSTWLAFELQVRQGVTVAEVSQQLGLSQNAVMIAKSRVLRRLRQLGQQLVDFDEE